MASLWFIIQVPLRIQQNNMKSKNKYLSKYQISNKHNTHDKSSWNYEISS